MGGGGGRGGKPAAKIHFSCFCGCTSVIKAANNCGKRERERENLVSLQFCKKCPPAKLCGKIKSFVKVHFDLSVIDFVRSRRAEMAVALSMAADEKSFYT